MLRFSPTRTTLRRGQEPPTTRSLSQDNELVSEEGDHTPVNSGVPGIAKQATSRTVHGREDGWIVCSSSLYWAYGGCVSRSVFRENGYQMTRVAEPGQIKKPVERSVSFFPPVKERKSSWSIKCLTKVFAERRQIR